MKCIYKNIKCTWPTEVGDIYCGACKHYTGAIPKHDADWLDKLITKIETWWKGLNFYRR